MITIICGAIRSESRHHKKHVQLLPDVHDFPTEGPEVWRSLDARKFERRFCELTKSTGWRWSFFLPEQPFIRRNC
jgi:hypothetical protein